MDGAVGAMRRCGTSSGLWRTESVTTIAAIQGDDFVVVAFDSMVSDGDDKIFTLPRSMPKVVRKRNCIYGAAGDLRAVNLLSTFTLPTPGAGVQGRDLDLWVGRTFVPDLKTLFQESGYEKENTHGSTILIAVNYTIYEIGSEYEWLRDARGIYSVGTGGNFALAHLVMAGPEINKDFSLAREAAVEAVELAAELDARTSMPVYVETLKKRSPRN